MALGTTTLACGCKLRLVAAPIRREEEGKAIVEMTAEIVAPCASHGHATRRPRTGIWPRTRKPRQPRRVDPF